MVRLGIGEKIIVALFAIYVINRFFGSSIAAFVLIVGLAVQFYKWYRASTVWQRLGVPCAPALPLLGHIIPYTRRGFQSCDVEWMKKYGKLYGGYLFTQPEIVISDEEILKRVLVKDFHNFTNRRVFDMSKKSIFNRMVSAMKDDEWKNTRNAITPAFTSGKLKNTVHLMENCVNTLCTILEEQKDEENGVDVRRVMGNLTLDVIAAAAFAMKIDAQRNPDNDFSKHAKVLGSITFKNWGILISIFFPWTVTMLDEKFDIRFFMAGMEEFYVENLTKIIQHRRQSPYIGKPDFLQLLMNEADNEKQENGEIDTTIDHGMTVPKKTPLTDRDIIAQSFLFLFAGHETSATTLAFACYLLALNPDEQEKCYDEIRGLVDNDEPITYTHIQRLPYLDAVISETLRLFPPATRFDRQTLDDYQLTDQLVIPKNSVIVVPVYAIHHSPDFYDDPEKFDPERFTVDAKKSTNPFAYLPFGYGPRNCIGMRFAQLEMKLALGNVLRKFRIEPCSKTEAYPPVFDVTQLLRAKTPIRLNFKKREN